MKAFAQYSIADIFVMFPLLTTLDLLRQKILCH